MRQEKLLQIFCGIIQGLCENASSPSAVCLTMGAAEAAKDHNLQGCRAQQHKSLTLHQLLTTAGIQHQVFMEKTSSKCCLLAKSQQEDRISCTGLDID